MADSGLANALYVGGFDLTSQAQSWNSSGPQATLDKTTINLKANARMGGKKSATVQVTSLFDAVGASHVHQAPMVYTDELFTLPHDTVLGSPVQCCMFKQIGYDPSRGEDGALLVKVDGESTESVLDWGKLLTAGKRVDAGATNGGSVDFGAAGAFGFQAYLHVFAFTGTDCTISLESSSDNAVGDPFSAVAGGAFTQVTAAPQTQKIYSGRTDAVERYLRVKTATAGGFASITFAVAVTVNPVRVDI